MKITNIGIVGCGTIGSSLAKSIVYDFSREAKLSALYDVDTEKAKKLASSLNKKNIVVLSLDKLIKRSDFVIESASAEASADIAIRAIQAKKDCLIMSVGGLIGNNKVFELAKRNKCSIYIPSGAICGVDGLNSHKLANIKKVILTTRKPPKALQGAPYIIKNKIDISNIKDDTVIFEGNAKDAVVAFPQNINISAVLSLAGFGAEKTIVKIVCSPHVSGNIHELEIESEAGKTFVRCENNPSPENPKTSYLAILSAIATLKKIFEPVKIGT